jgi:hypothetical protein
METTLTHEVMYEMRESGEPHVRSLAWPRQSEGRERTTYKRILKPLTPSMRTFESRFMDVGPCLGGCVDRR